MLSVVVGLVLIVLGLITAAVWLAPAGDDAPFDVSHSWLVGEARGASATLAVAAALASIAAGIGWLAGRVRRLGSPSWPERPGPY